MQDTNIKRITLRINADKLKQLRLIAVKKDTSINSILMTLVDKYLIEEAAEA